MVHAGADNFVYKYIKSTKINTDGLLHVSMDADHEKHIENKFMSHLL